LLKLVSIYYLFITIYNLEGALSGVDEIVHSDENDDPNFGK